MAIARQVSHGICSTLLVVSLAVSRCTPASTGVAMSAPVLAQEPSTATPAPRPAEARPRPLEPPAAVLPPANDTGRPVTTAGATAPVARRAYVVAAIGDSLTDFRSHGGGYLTILQERCPESRFYSFGKGGDMVNQMRSRLEKNVLAAPSVPYTHLIVFGGVNDLYSDLTAGRTVPKIAKDLLAMYADAHQHNMKVVAMTVSPWGGFSRYFTEPRGAATLELNRFILEQQKTGAADFVVDTYPLLSCGDPERLCDALMAPFHDGLHFGPAAHRKLADALFDTVFSDCR
jgi:lysophospholipase L1-like esterase